MPEHRANTTPFHPASAHFQKFGPLGWAAIISLFVLILDLHVWEARPGPPAPNSQVSLHLLNFSPRESSVRREDNVSEFCRRSEPIVRLLSVCASPVPPVRPPSSFQTTFEFPCHKQGKMHSGQQWGHRTPEQTWGESKRNVVGVGGGGRLTGQDEPALPGDYIDLPLNQHRAGPRPVDVM